MAVVAKQENKAPAGNGRAESVRYLTPPANILERADGYVLQLDLPGVRKAGLEVTVEANELRVVGHREEPEFPGELIYRESRTADFQRTFELDPSIDASKVTAKFEDGVATLWLPKSEEVQPRQIKVS